MGRRYKNNLFIFVGNSKMIKAIGYVLFKVWKSDKGWI